MGKCGLCSRANEVGGREDERGREGEIKERGREGERERGPLNQMKELGGGGGSAICIMAFINQKTNLPFLNLGGGIHSQEEEDTQPTILLHDDAKK